MLIIEIFKAHIKKIPERRDHSSSEPPIHVSMLPLAHKPNRPRFQVDKHPNKLINKLPIRNRPRRSTSSPIRASRPIPVLGVDDSSNHSEIPQQDVERQQKVDKRAARRLSASPQRQQQTNIDANQTELVHIE